MRAVVSPVRISVHCRPRLCDRFRAAGRAITVAIAAAAVGVGVCIADVMAWARGGREEPVVVVGVRLGGRAIRLVLVGCDRPVAALRRRMQQLAQLRRTSPVERQLAALHTNVGKHELSSSKPIKARVNSGLQVTYVWLTPNMRRARNLKVRKVETRNYTSGEWQMAKCEGQMKLKAAVAIRFY